MNIRRSLLVASALVGLSSAAFAGNCPALMDQIDRAIPSATVDQAKLDEVKSLRTSGEAKHNAGDHAGSVADLTKAMEILGVK